MGLAVFLAEILLIGHSLVGPVLPGMLEQAFRSRGADVDVAAQIINGAPLRYNWDNSAKAEGVDGRAVLRKGGVEALIVTEAGPVAEHVRWNDSKGYVARFHDLARKGSPGVETYLYEIWPVYTGSPAAWQATIAAELPLWEDMLARGRGAPMKLIPVAQAMAELSREIEAGRVPGVRSTKALFTDGIHPTGVGWYFVTMVIHAAITGQSPEGLPARLARQYTKRADVVDDATARAMQKIAWKAVRGYRQSSRRGAAPPEARIIPAAATATGDDPPKAGFAPVTRPNLGLGLAGIDDWSTQQPFLDVMKTARPWFGPIPGERAVRDEAWLAAKGALGPDGWPRRVPAGVTGIETLVLTDLPPDAVDTAGTYRLTYRGQGTLEVGGRAENLRVDGQTIRFDFTPGEDGVTLTLTAIDPDDPIRDIVIVADRHAAALDGGALFNPDWIARIRGVSLVRFMDWMATNNSTQRVWSDRPRPGDYSWARVGVPVEVMIALANTLGADPWFTLPHMADDTYVRAFATAVRDGLDPALRAHVEYSNEMWNWQFTQARWAEDQARLRWGREHGWVQFYAARATEIADIWTEVFGADAPRRLARVIATQTGWAGLEDQILTAPMLRAADPNADPPFQHFDLYAITGYFSGNLGDASRRQMVLDWLAESQAAAQAAADVQGLTGDDALAYVAAHRFDLATRRAAREIEAGLESGAPVDTLDQFLTEVLPYHADVAARHGLQLAMYEGGTHVVGFGPMVEDADLTAFFTHLNFTPDMGALYRRAIDGWSAATDQPFNAFVDVYKPNKWGSWGALRHLSDDSPRWRAIAGAP